MSEITVQSMVSMRTREPMVSIYWPKDVDAAQLTPDKAREFALSVLQAAEAAEQDEFMFTFATKRIGVDEASAAGLINEYRLHRGQERGPDGQTPASEE